MTTPSGTASNRMMRLAGGEQIMLADVLATAGEGTVYAVHDRPALAAKIFHPTLTGLEDKLAKVAAMVGSPPPGTVQPNGFVVLTWPTGIINDQNGPVGFVMPRIDTTTAVEIHTMSNPSDRMNPLPAEPQWTVNVTWGHLVNTAANLCLAVQVVHRVDAVIGDFQERNILVSDTTEVSLVDCDSMQFTDETGTRYLCGVGRPEFTAPELVGLDLRTQPREQPSDLFALAVHIHQLLMGGNHPFLRGTWTGGGDQPSALQLARSGSWAGGPGSPLLTHRMAPPITFLPMEIQQMFVRAFTDGARDPSRRPSAQEWRDGLLRIQLTNCGRGIHHVPVGTMACPWCVIDDEKAKRQSNQAFGRSGPWSSPVTGPQSLAVRAPQTPKERLYAKVEANSGRIVAGIWAAVIVVLVLTAFIVWAILSGASTFGT